jgi:anhydro-N-acetylmuramic acid kinase
VIAQRTRLNVVSHFVQADLAAGGVGSPLSAFADWVLFRDRRLSRIVVHLGGITSMTFVGADPHPADVVALDVGPGTAMLDSLTEREFGLPFDADGALAARGNVSSQLLNELMSNPYFRRKPPKSCPPAEWGDAFLWRLNHLARKRRCEREDLLATATEMIARSIANAASTMTERPHQVVLSGGGSRNINLAGRIRTLMAPSSTITTEKFAVPVTAKQALAFAILAAARVEDFAPHTKLATGAKEPVVLGTVAVP